MNDSTIEIAAGTSTSNAPARYDKLAVRRLARCIAELRELHSEI